MSSNAPRYVKIAEVLEEEVSRLAPNSLLPTEDQLARRFEVSRITVRAALELLENSGLISRLRGRGTIVSPKKLVRNLSPFMSFEADMTSQGISFATRVLSFEGRTVPPTAIARRLELPANSRVARLSLVRDVSDQVVCHDYRYYPEEIGRKIDVRKAESMDCALLLEEAARTRIHRSLWENEILSASPEVASALGLASRALVFVSIYTWFAENGRPIETGMISYRIDRCKFRFREAFTHPARAAAEA
jgi:GntR family transcriptional regulator